MTNAKRYLKDRPDLYKKLSNIAYELDVTPDELIVYLLEHEIATGLSYAEAVRELAKIREELEEKKRNNTWIASETELDKDLQVWNVIFCILMLNKGK